MTARGRSANRACRSTSVRHAPYLGSVAMPTMTAAEPSGRNRVATIRSLSSPIPGTRMVRPADWRACSTSALKSVPDPDSMDG